MSYTEKQFKEDDKNLQVFKTDDGKVILSETKEGYSLYLNNENTSILISKDKVNYLLKEGKLLEVLEEIHSEGNKNNASEIFFQRYEELIQMNGEDISQIDENDFENEEEIDEETMRLREEYEKEKLELEKIKEKEKKGKIIDFDSENSESDYLFRINSLGDIKEFVKNLFDSGKDKGYFYFPKYDLEILCVVKDEEGIWTIGQNGDIPNIQEIIQRNVHEDEENSENILFYLMNGVNHQNKIIPGIQILFNYITGEKIDNGEIKEFTRRYTIEYLQREKENKIKEKMEERSGKTVEDMTYDELRKYMLLIRSGVDSKNIHEYKRDLEDEMVEVQGMIDERNRVIKEFESDSDKASIFEKLNKKIESGEINNENIEEVLNTGVKKVNSIHLEGMTKEQRRKIIDQQIEEELEEMRKIEIGEEIHGSIGLDNIVDNSFKESIDNFSYLKTLASGGKIKGEELFEQEDYDRIVITLRKMLVVLNNEDTFLDITSGNNSEVNKVLYGFIKEYGLKGARVRSKSNMKESDIIMEEIILKTPNGGEFIFDIKETGLTGSKIHGRFILRGELSSNYVEIEDQIKLNERTRNLLKTSRKVKNNMNKMNKNEEKYSNNSRSNRRGNNRQTKNYENNYSYGRSTGKIIGGTYRVTKKVVGGFFKGIYNFFFK